MQQGGVANRGSALAKFCGHALAGQRAEFANVFDLYAALGGGRNECGSEWMFTSSLETGGERQDRVFGEALRWNDRNNARLAFG